MEQYSFTRVQTRLANLLSSRRLRFPYINGETGDFKWKKFPLILLNTLGSCLNIPTLFYISFYVLAIYPGLNLKPLDMLSVVFFASAMSILFDVFIGYIFDKFIKPYDGGRPNPGLRNIFCVLSTIGLAIALAFFFRIDINQEEATRQFRVTLLLIMFLFAIANCTSYKSSVHYTPFQEDRRKIFHLEYFLKGFIIFIYVSFPLWAKFWSSDCSCGDACKNDPASAACTDCMTKCDTFTGSDLDYFRVPALVFTSIFGLANIISQFVVKTRNDEDREDIPTTYNRRLVEIQTNKFLLKTFFISLLEFSILFGFAIWTYYYIYQEVTYSRDCLDTWGSSAYMCSKGFWLQLTVILMFLFSAFTFILSRVMKFIMGASIKMTVLTIITGILIVTIQPDSTTQFCFIAIFMAGFFGSFAATKLIHSNGIYYDEYKSGVTQPNLPTFILLLSIKLGFLFALAFHLTFLSPSGFAANATHYNNEAFGGWVIFASVVILVLKAFINNYDIEAFDKIQIAIERNINLQQDDIAFYDPIAKEPVRCPVISFHNVEKRLIKLMYNLTPKDMFKIINGKQPKVQSNAMMKLVVHAILVIIFTILITVFGQYFNTPWAWLMAVGMLYIPISLIAMLHEYNVWVAAGTLDSSRYKSVDRNILLRFVLFLQPAQPPQPTECECGSFITA